jgi:glycerophosphoryl diester phosphodiesterase
LFEQELKKPWIIAHRGASGNFPENTIPAFWEAIKLKADIIELDLQLTADNEIVVFHDKTVERIFEIRSEKTIQEYKLKELKKFDAGSWFDKKYSEVKVPTLEEVISALPINASLILELKGSEDKLISQLLEILDRTKKTLGLGYISVRDTETISRILDVSNKYHIGLMQKKRTPREFLNEMLENNPKVGQIRWKNWSEADWLLLENVEFTVTACCADELEEFAYLCGKEIDGILTNFPSKLSAYLDRMDY